MAFKEKWSYYQTLTESMLRVLADQSDTPQLLYDSMTYSLFAGGKRLRPALCLSTSEMLDGTATDALKAACALEMIHTYSLIHDDLPAMDNDAIRRGKPSNHVRFGEANAILAGDALLTKAALVLFSQRGNDEAKQAIFEGAYAMGSGQSDDLNLTERSAEVLERIHLNKTGALFRAACVAGAYLSDPRKAESMRIFGDTLGLLFQMTDDLLDEEKDREEGKLTYVTFYGREKTVGYIEEAAHRAEAILAPYTGEAAETLRELIHTLRSRTI